MAWHACRDVGHRGQVCYCFCNANAQSPHPPIASGSCFFAFAFAFAFALPFGCLPNNFTAFFFLPGESSSSASALAAAFCLAFAFAFFWLASLPVDLAFAFAFELANDVLPSILFFPFFPWAAWRTYCMHCVISWIVPSICNRDVTCAWSSWMHSVMTWIVQSRWSGDMIHAWYEFTNVLLAWQSCSGSPSCSSSPFGLFSPSFSTFPSSQSRRVRMAANGLGYCTHLTRTCKYRMSWWNLEAILFLRLVVAGHCSRAAAPHARLRKIEPAFKRRPCELSRSTNPDVM